MSDIIGDKSHHNCSQKRSPVRRPFDLWHQDITLRKFQRKRRWLITSDTRLPKNMRKYLLICCWLFISTQLTSYSIGSKRGCRSMHAPSVARTKHCFQVGWFGNAVKLNEPCIFDLYIVYVLQRANFRLLITMHSWSSALVALWNQWTNDKESFDELLTDEHEKYSDFQSYVVFDDWGLRRDHTWDMRTIGTWSCGLSNDNAWWTSVSHRLAF